MKIQENFWEQIDCLLCFLAFPRFRDCSYRQERKKLVKNEVLDVKKFADTAKNEAFQNPGIVTRSMFKVLFEGSRSWAYST